MAVKDITHYIFSVNGKPASELTFDEVESHIQILAMAYKQEWPSGNKLTMDKVAGQDCWKVTLRFVGKFEGPECWRRITARCAHAADRRAAKAKSYEIDPLAERLVDELDREANSG